MPPTIKKYQVFFGNFAARFDLSAFAIFKEIFHAFSNQANPTEDLFGYQDCDLSALMIVL